MRTLLQPSQYMKVQAVAFLLCLGVSSQAQEAATTVETNKPPAWDVSASLGFSSTSGNSETLLLTGSLVGKRKFDDANLELGAAGAYGENDHIRNVQTLRGWGQYDDSITERTYWYGRVEGYHDGIADIQYRFTIGPGIGYYFIKKEKTMLRGEFGPSWIYQRLGDENNDYFSLRFAERFEHQFNERVKLYQTLEWLPELTDWENYLMNFEVGVESALSEKMSVTLSFTDNYNSRPASDRKHNDTRLVAGLKYKF